MRSAALVVIVLAALAAAAPQKPAAPFTAEQQAALIKSALSAAPKAIAEHATVLAPGPDGKMAVIQTGTNGFYCFPDDPATPGNDPACGDAEAMKWFDSWGAHADKPANTSPGIIYMLAGGSDASNTDPFAKATKDTKWVTTGPHWMLMWPVDAKSGFSTTPQKSGTFIMFAGTPYAHLMINGKP